MMTEEWKEFSRTKSATHARIYEVSNFGNVRSRNANLGLYRGCWRYLKKIPAGYNNNYLKVSAGRESAPYIHSLVLEAFVCKRPKGLQANHKDLDTTNNNVDNLEWVTPSENASHMQKAYGGVNQFTQHRTKSEAQKFITNVEVEK